MSRFTADCSRCCGLCCFVPAYLQEQGFPLDKPAEEPCQHLLRNGLCGIHARRIEMGFGACGGFDCHGAGQWITQQLFGGTRWQDCATTARAMASAWSHWLPRFESAALLEAALALVGEEHGVLLEARIDALLDASRDAKPHTDRLRLRQETLSLIRTLLPAHRRPAGPGDLH
jgi:hypothetical protein